MQRALQDLVQVDTEAVERYHRPVDPPRLAIQVRRSVPHTQPAHRAATAVRRLLGGTRSRSAGNPDLEPELQQAKRQLRRLRARLKKSQADVQRLQQDLQQTRESVCDPDPRIELSPALTDLIMNVREERLTHLLPTSLTTLARLVVGLEQSGQPGILIEAGTARGGSAIVLGAAKSLKRPLKVYDVFGLIPPPSDSDGPDIQRRYRVIKSGRAKGIGGDSYYGYRDDLYGEVTESFRRFGVEVESNNVELIRGLFNDTMVIDEPVALAHLDGDWYESTLTCLERIAPMLVPGGRIVVDDYYMWSGCRTAVDEYFTGHAGFHVERRAKVHIVRL